MKLIIDDKPNTVQGIVDFLEKENKKITQSEHGVRIRLSVAERRYSERMSQSSEKVE